MSAHTPGPWTVDETEHAGIYFVSANKVSFTVATVVHGEADARLIAAAPDLLEALDALADASGDAVDSFGGHSLECDCEQCGALSKLAPVIELARAAIARAEGGAS